MPSGNVPSFTDLAGGQSPTDQVYVAKDPFGLTDDRHSTLNDLFDEITKNVSNLSIQWIDGDGTAPVSDAGKGRLKYSDSAASGAGSFQVSEDGAAYQNLIKGPASAGNLTANLLPFATANDVIGDTAFAQLGTTTSRTASFNPHNPGATISYASIRFSIVDQSGFINFANFGFPRITNYALGGGTLAAPVVAVSDAELFRLDAFAQITTTPGTGTALGVRQAVYATENWGAANSGAGWTVETQANAVTPNNRITRLAINQQGTVHVWPGVSGTAITTVGTNTIFEVGGPGATQDNDAVAFFGHVSHSTGSTDLKNVVIQQKSSQAGELFETQSATGVSQFSIVPQTGVACHFINWAGSSNAPSVSAAGSARLYINASGKAQISENGGAYVDLVSGATSPGGNDTNVQFNDGGAFGGEDSFIFDKIAVALAVGELGVSTGTIEWRHANGNSFSLSQGIQGGPLSFTLPTTGGAAGNLLFVDTGVLDWTTGYSYDAAADWTLSGAPTAGKTGLLIYEPTGTAPSTVQGLPVTLHLHVVNDNTYWSLGYTSDATTYEWTTQLRDSGQFFFYGSDGGGPNADFQFTFVPDTTVGEWDFYPKGFRTFSISATYYGGFAEIASDVFGLMLTTGTPTSGAQFPLAWTDSGVGINKTSALNAQLHVVSGSASRIANQVESASGATVTLNNFIHTTDQTNAVAVHSQFYTRSSGTAATGLGGRLLFGIESSTTNDQSAAAIDWSWTSALHGFLDAILNFSVVKNSVLVTPISITPDYLNVTQQSTIEPGIRVNYTSGTNIVKIGTNVSQSSYGIIYLGDVGAVSTTNYALRGNGSTTILNAPNGDLVFRIGDAGVPNAFMYDQSQGGLVINDLSASAALHAVALSTSRVGLLIESASGSTVDLVQFTLTSNQTNAVAVNTEFTVNSSGTAATGLGGQLLFQLESSTTASQSAAAMNWIWANATHASRTAAITFSIVNNAAALAEVLRIEGPGWLIAPELGSDPTTTQLADGNQFAIYRKNDRFVIAYNDGGTITYLYADLDGATTTWTQTTTAP